MKTILVDLTRCNGCYNCQIACKDEHVDNDWPPVARPQPDTGHFWMKVENRERGVYPKVKIAYVPLLCQHCQNAACIEAAEDEAVYRRDDGIVIIDPMKARGQKQIAGSCPYGVIFWNEELQIAQKCTLCAHLLDNGWKEPRCVEACPTDALVYGEYEDLQQIAQSRGKQTELLNPEYGLKPSLLYIGLPTRFIAGTVLFADINECAENVSVTLTGEKTGGSVLTNNYGDFEFEGLVRDKVYKVIVEHEGYAAQSFEVTTAGDVYLGNIGLERKSK